MNLASRQQVQPGAAAGAVAGSARESPALAGPPASPPAARASGRTWRDPRLLVGIALVAGCVLLGARILAAADDSVLVWSVRADMTAGSPVTVQDLQRESLRFESSALAGRYVSAEHPLPEGMVLARDVVAGELLPRGVLGPGGQVELVEVPLAVASEAVPVTLRPGELVDVWVTPAGEPGRVTRAVRVLQEVRVMAVPSSAGALGPAATRQVVVGVPAQEESRLAAALAQLSGGTAVIVRRG